MTNAHPATEELAAQKRALRDKRRYVRLRLRDSNCLSGGCICPPIDAARAMAEDPELVAEDVWMTQAQYDALPEFMGW